MLAPTPPPPPNRSKFRIVFRFPQFFSKTVDLRGKFRINNLKAHKIYTRKSGMCLYPWTTEAPKRRALEVEISRCYPEWTVSLTFFANTGKTVDCLTTHNNTLLFHPEPPAGYCCDVREAEMWIFGLWKVLKFSICSVKKPMLSQLYSLTFSISSVNHRKKKDSVKFLVLLNYVISYFSYQSIALSIEQYENPKNPGV